MDIIEIIKILYEISVGISFVGKIIIRNGIDERLKQEGYVRNTYVGKYARKSSLGLLLESLVPIKNLEDIGRLGSIGIDGIYNKYRNNGILTGNIIEREKRKPRFFDKSFEEIMKEMFPVESRGIIQRVDYRPQNKGNDTDEKSKQYKK